jgi:hypothetical protein
MRFITVYDENRKKVIINLEQVEYIKVKDNIVYIGMTSGYVIQTPDLNIIEFVNFSTTS